MLTELWQIVLENLFEELHDFSHLRLVEAIERHNREFSDHIAKGDEGLMLIHIEKQNCCYVGHPLDVANVWPMHSEGLQHSLKRIIVPTARLKHLELRECPRQVSLNDAYASLSALNC